ncbi:MAG: hypothetical protein O7G30_12545, partial [Proteobacteria bacterium]|nr:hypothetical protein [Pseudomonadota bacterium]
EVMVEGERIYGDGVNVAARLEAEADAGGVCLSAKVVEEVRGKIDLRFAYVGERRLKNLPTPVRIFRIGEAGAAPERAPGRRWMGWTAAVAAGIAALGLLWALSPDGPPGSYGQRATETPAPPAVRSLAVLPLANLSGDPSQDYFAAGMTEALIGDLARSAALSVVSRTSVMQYHGAERPLPEIAAELGVDTVLEGTVLRVGDSVRITAQLLDARTDRHLWSGSYERDLRDVLALQRDVARAIASEIQLELAPAAETRPVNPAAYEAYLQGRHLVHLQGAINHVKGISLLERAVELDPDYAPAWAQLSVGYT